MGGPPAFSSALGTKRTGSTIVLHIIPNSSVESERLGPISRLAAASGWRTFPSRPRRDSRGRTSLRVGAPAGHDQGQVVVLLAGAEGPDLVHERVEDGLRGLAPVAAHRIHETLLAEFLA